MIDYTKKALLIFSALLTINGCNHQISKNIQNSYNIKYNFKKEIVITEKVGINDNDFILEKTQKNELKGLEDIIELNKTSPFEENWTYLPEKETWYETGVLRETIKSNNGSYIASISTPTEYLENILAKNSKISEVIEYHNHPTTKNIINSNKVNTISTEEMIKRFKNDYYGDDYKNTNKILDDAFDRKTIPGAKPSIADIRTMVIHTLAIGKEKKLISKISSETGVTSYVLTEKGYKKFKSISTPKEYFYGNVTIIKENGYLLIKDDFLIIEYKSFDKVFNKNN